MTREIHADTLAASITSVIRPFWMVSLNYDIGTVRASTLPYGMDIVYGGSTWYALGDLGTISKVKEKSDHSVPDIELTLSGIDPTKISVALNQYYQGREAVIYLGLLDADHVVIGEPMVIFRGLMDNQTLTIGDTCSIRVTIKSRLARLLTPKASRYNNETQQVRYAGDKGLEFVEQSARKEIAWGSGVRKR